MGLIYMDSPVGLLKLRSVGNAVAEISFEEQRWETEQTDDVLEECRRQLGEYFSGTRRTFDVPLVLEGTAFQKKVWQALCKIPYGTVWSYGDLAREIGNPKAVRAVGGANHKNPVSIIVPCHRVIGADGSLTGYGGGLDKKEFLLRLEGAIGE